MTIPTFSETGSVQSNLENNVSSPFSSLDRVWQNKSTKSVLFCTCVIRREAGKVEMCYVRSMSAQGQAEPKELD